MTSAIRTLIKLAAIIAWLLFLPTTRALYPRRLNFQAAFF